MKKIKPESYRQKLIAIFEDGEPHELCDLEPDFRELGMSRGSFHASISHLYKVGLIERIGYGKYRKTRESTLPRLMQSDKHFRAFVKAVDLNFRDPAFATTYPMIKKQLKTFVGGV
jgi:Mn-dependent DtxR family transcriptional regulator